MFLRLQCTVIEFYRPVRGVCICMYWFLEADFIHSKEKKLSGAPVLIVDTGYFGSVWPCRHVPWFCLSVPVMILEINNRVTSVVVAVTLVPNRDNGGDPQSDFLMFWILSKISYWGCKWGTWCVPPPPRANSSLRAILIKKMLQGNKLSTPVQVLLLQSNF